MFERFTDRARQVLQLAQEEARLLGHSFIGTEHILLGLVHEGDGVAARVLEDLGVSLTRARREVERIVGRPGSAAPGNPPFTPRAKKVLELSLREALQLGHRFIGTEHILLGLVREGEGVGTQVLVALGAEPGRVRQKVHEMTGAVPPEPARAAEREAARAGSPRRRRGGGYGPAAAPWVWAPAPDWCSLCGTDLWSAARYVEADGVRVCDRCVGAAATVLAAAGAGPRALALPPLVFGEAPDEGSVEEIAAAVRALVGPAEERHRRETAIEDVPALAALLRALDDRLAGWERVSRVRFVAPDRAELRFHFKVVGDDRELAVQGSAMRAGGRWVLARTTVADALERAGVRMPQPGV